MQLVKYSVWTRRKKVLRMAPGHGRRAAGDTSLRWPCSECACGTAEPPTDLVPVAVTSFGDGREGGMEWGPAVGSSPGRCPGNGLAPPAPPGVLQSTRQTLGSQLSPPSVVSGGLFGTLPRMRQALCSLCSSTHSPRGPTLGLPGLPVIMEAPWAQPSQEGGSEALASPRTDCTGFFEVCSGWGRKPG